MLYRTRSGSSQTYTPSRTRTADKLIKSQLLYQLSYGGTLSVSTLHLVFLSRREPLVRFELTTHALRMRCSTPELQRQMLCAAAAYHTICAIASLFLEKNHFFQKLRRLSRKERTHPQHFLKKPPLLVKLMFVVVGARDFSPEITVLPIGTEVPCSDRVPPRIPIYQLVYI